MPEENLNTSNSINIPQTKVYGFFTNGIIHDEQGEIIWDSPELMREEFTIEELLFKTHVSDNEYIGSGFIGYLRHKLNLLQWEDNNGGEKFYKARIRDFPNRYQGLINCISKSLIGISSLTNEVNQREDFEFLKNTIINDLYGYLYSFPEVLELNGKPRDCTIEHLIQECKKLQTERRKQEIGEELAEKVMEIFLIDHDTEKNHEVYKHLKSVYSEGGSPKIEELSQLGLDPILTQAIVESGSYKQIDDIVNPEPELLGEDGEYKLFELSVMKHLEEESEITGHCVGEGSFYYNKIQKGDIRIFSLRLGNERVTIEYSNKFQSVLQIQGPLLNKNKCKITSSIIRIMKKLGINVCYIKNFMIPGPYKNMVFGKIKGEKNYQIFGVDFTGTWAHNDISYVHPHDIEDILAGEIIYSMNYTDLKPLFKFPGLIIKIHLMDENDQKIIRESEINFFG